MHNAFFDHEAFKNVLLLLIIQFGELNFNLSCYHVKNNDKSIKCFVKSTLAFFAYFFYIEWYGMVNKMIKF